MSCDPGRVAAGENWVVRASGLTKTYRIFPKPVDRFRQALWGRHRRFYREFEALRNVDVEVQRGEVVGVIGRNGSGKSTLLRLICGTTRASTGQVELRGRVAPILSLGVGFNPDSTGLENARIGAIILGVAESELAERMERIRSFADLGSFFEDPIRTYSSGMQARLAFSVAACIQPDLLVLDEILAVGDEAFARKCFDRIEELRSNGTGILLVSHSAPRIVELCDRVLLLEGGEEIFWGDPKLGVSYYQRLLYSTGKDRVALREEIAARERETRAACPRSREVVGSSGPVPKSHYDPKLVPRTTVEYGSRSAKIADLMLRAPGGEPANVLAEGGLYYFTYRVEFAEAARGVRFGMMVKLMTGFELAGQTSHPPGDGMEIPAGAVVSVRFPFRARLRPGTYFANAGVLGWTEEGEGYLHRILDAVMFRVERGSPSRVTGEVDLTEGTAEVSVK